MRNDPVLRERGRAAPVVAGVLAGRSGGHAAERSASCCGPMPRYLRGDYHPSQEGSTEAALAYLAALAGRIGLRRRQLSPARVGSVRRVARRCSGTSRRRTPTATTRWSGWFGWPTRSDSTSSASRTTRTSRAISTRGRCSRCSPCRRPACGCSPTSPICRCATRRCWPRRRPRSTASRVAGSSSGWARARCGRRSKGWACGAATRLSRCRRSRRRSPCCA